jgi:hypothetical protein
VHLDDRIGARAQRRLGTLIHANLAGRLVGDGSHRPTEDKRDRLAAIKRLLLVSVVALAAGAAAAIGASTSTRTHIYQAWSATGKPTITVTTAVNGSCFSGSIAINRNDAWRCNTGNLIADPCFSSSKTTGAVLCPARPWKRTGIKITLTKSLPVAMGNKHTPSTSGLPWGILTFSGLHCQIATGTLPVIMGKPGRYFCAKSSKLLWGRPSRKTEPWTIFIAPATSKTLTHKVKIKVAWF